MKGVGCLGPCSEGPLLAIDTGGVSRLIALKDSALEFFAADLEEHLGRQSLVDWHPSRSREIFPDEPFIALQRRLVLAHCGCIDPTSLDEAEEAGAYLQLQRVLEANDPLALIDQVKLSGLRGRGGAGYPTGLKWAAVAAMTGDNKVVVCNADEGDPGAFMDRTVMEGDPHALLEGMVIAGFAVGRTAALFMCGVNTPWRSSDFGGASSRPGKEAGLGIRLAPANSALTCSFVSVLAPTCVGRKQHSFIPLRDAAVFPDPVHPFLLNTACMDCQH